MQAHTLWFCFSHIQTGGSLALTIQISGSLLGICTGHSTCFTCLSYSSEHSMTPCEHHPRRDHSYQIKVDHWEYIWIYWPASLINLTPQSTYTSTLGCGRMLEYPRRHGENMETPFTMYYIKKKREIEIKYNILYFNFSFLVPLHILYLKKSTRKHSASVAMKTISLFFIVT